MDAGLLAQYLIVALVVLASVAIVMRSQLPATTRKLRVAIALPLLREGRAGWVKSIGRFIAPAPKAGGGGCGGCDSCD
ncbi:MAG: hypothetical protein QM612_08200 [Thermomonas sp.]|uniref:DUF6587 family protein n=1 Tax=Thermomonas sp. TaxID=1971895 RepID=UPI0039E59756